MTKRDRGGYALATAFFLATVWSEYGHHPGGITDDHKIRLLLALLLLGVCLFLSERDARRKAKPTQTFTIPAKDLESGPVFLEIRKTEHAARRARP